MDELVKALRETDFGDTCVLCEHEDMCKGNDCIIIQAADAIEELSRRCEQFQYMPPPAWFPVTERLPEDDTDVLCWYEYYHWSAEKVLPEYGIGHCWNGRWGGEVSNGRECKVLAWMPLPQPPKEET